MKKFIFLASALFAMCLFTTATSAQVNTYSVTNSSGMVITGVSISPNDANKWGTNLNTTGNVAIDRSFEFTQPLDNTNCVYDVRYQAEDGTYYYVQDVDMCAGTSITLTNPAQHDRGKMK